MKKLRLHIYLVLGLVIAGLMAGSFLDLQINQALFSNKNTFGLIISVIGTIPGYGMLAFLSGGFIAIAVTKKEYKGVYKVILYVLSVVLLGLSIFFSGREFFGPNGFTGAMKEWLGYLFVLPIMGGILFLGYKLVSQSTRQYMWLIIALFAFAMFMALIPGTTLLKSLLHRPRYRSIYSINDERLFFHNWWERCSNYKALMTEFGLEKEEFKSFPSGHASASSCFMLIAIILPYINRKFEKYSLPLFYTGLAWTILVSFTRMLVGAHFLSDVSMGFLLTMVSMLILNEVLIRVRIFSYEDIKEAPKDIAMEECE